MNGKLLILIALIALTARAHVPDQPERRVDWITNAQGKTESWTWTRDSRGHHVVTIRDAFGAVVRVWVFDVSPR